MTPFETINVDTVVVACNGGGGALGHPRVYLNLAPAGQAECPYCSRLFVNRALAAQGLPKEGVAGDTDKPDEPAPAPVTPAAAPTPHARPPQADTPR